MEIKLTEDQIDTMFEIARALFYIGLGIIVSLIIMAATHYY
jgi:hypothetical protein